MIDLISGNNLEIEIELNPNEKNDDEVVLDSHCLVTPDTFEFKVINNKNFNFKYRGRIWLLNNKLIFKGYEIISFNLQEDALNTNKLRPICNIDYSKPIVIEIPNSKIEEIFIGHDEIFKRKYLMHPKLKISYEIDNKENNFYIFLVNENLLVDTAELNEKLKKWEVELKSRIPRKLSEIPIDSLDESEIISELSNVLIDDEDIEKPIPIQSDNRFPEPPQIAEAPPEPPQIMSSPPEPPNISKPETEVHQVIIGGEIDQFSEISSPMASPIAQKKKAKPKIGRVVIESDEDEYYSKPAKKEVSQVLKPSGNKKDEDKEKNVLYEILKPAEMDDDTFKELTNIQPDSSITRCKKCGWIIRYDQLKCPRCGADTLY